MSRSRRWVKSTARVAAAVALAQVVSWTGDSVRSASAGSERLVWPGSIETVARQLASDDVEARRRAAQNLTLLPHAVQRRLLPAAFGDPDPEVRLAVADAALAVRLPDAGGRVLGWLSDPDARVREAAAEVLGVLRHPAAIPGLGRVLEDPEASVRAAAALALGNSRSPDATLFLLGHLDDSDPEVRHAVISALRDLRDPRAVVPLIGRIQEQRAALRRQAASALGALGDSRAASALIVALGDGDAGVRAAAAQSLGELRARDAVWSLGALLETEPDPDVQGAIVDALGSIAAPNAVDAILASLSRPRPSAERVRQALARAGEAATGGLERCIFQPVHAEASSICTAALGVIGGETAGNLAERALRENVVSPAVALTALGATRHVRALPTVLEYLTSSVPAERRAAIEAAGQMLEPERRLGVAVEPIALALSRARGGRLEQAALIALLGRTGSARAAPTLAPFAASADEYLRAVAIEALGEIGASGSDDVLLAALDSTLFPTRWTAAVALRRVGSRAALAPLLTRMAAAAPAERTTLAVALAGPLADAPSPADVARVVRWVHASAGPVKDALIEALARVPDGAGVAPLAQSMTLLARATRAKLAEAMGAHEQARAALSGLLRDPDGAVRANAIWSLGSVGRPEDLDALSEAVADRELTAAANAVAAVALLASRHGLDASRPLCSALADARSYVRANALAGLRRTGSACPDMALGAWLLEHDRSEEVRWAAARLLRDGPLWRDANPGALDRCAAKDVSGRVAAECLGKIEASAAQSSDSVEVEVLVVPTGATSPAAGAPFGLLRADGFIRSGSSDRRGAVWEPRAPRGPLRLTVPAVFAD